MTQFYFHRSNTKKRRRADSTELNGRCLTTSDPVTSFFIPSLRGASKSASTDLNDKME